MLRLFKPATCETLIYWTRRANKIFAGFITGKILDSLIIGVICYVCMLLFGIEYPLLISVIVGVTNIIPFFGPFIGAIPSALILLLVNPLSALWFLVFILILQQLDGNVIGPFILGDYVGVSAFWIMLSIMVGGGLFGFAGMLLGVPVFALVYAIVRTVIETRLRKRNLPGGQRFYIQGARKPTGGKSMKHLIFDCGGVLVYPRLGEWNLPFGAAEILGERARDIHTSKYLLAHRESVGWLDEGRLVNDIEEERRLRREYIRAMDVRMDWHMTAGEIARLTDDFTDNPDRYGLFEDVGALAEALEAALSAGRAVRRLPLDTEVHEAVWHIRPVRRGGDLHPGGRDQARPAHVPGHTGRAGRPARGLPVRGRPGQQPGGRGGAGHTGRADGATRVPACGDLGRPRGAQLRGAERADRRVTPP